MPTLTAAGRAGCLSFCPGWPRMNIQPRAKHVMCHATLTLGGLRTLGYSLPRTRVLHAHSSHSNAWTSSKSCSVFCGVAVVALWRKNKADGWTQEAPYAPTCSTGQQCGRVQWRSPHSPWCLSRCMEEVLRESSVHICFRGNFRRGVSRKTKLSQDRSGLFLRSLGPI